jgi:SAM-dependent methyltransferase
VKDCTGADVSAPGCYVYRMSKADTSSLRANDLADEARAEVADLLDLQLSPLGLRAIEALSAQIGEAILDVGCGAGQSVLQLAGRVGLRGRVTGADIAPLVLEVAHRRAVGRSQVDFIERDVLKFALPERSIDCVFSRFGVMAFRDPRRGVLKLPANDETLRSAGLRLLAIRWTKTNWIYFPSRRPGLKDGPTRRHSASRTPATSEPRFNQLVSDRSHSSSFHRRPTAAGP